MNKDDFYKLLLSELSYRDNSLLSKVSYIKKMPNGKWVVMSRKGKPLGTYKTKQEAVKRLRQIEFFKHKKATHEELNYTALMREIDKDYSPEVLREFRKEFKQAFDQALLEEDENPEETALSAAIGYLDEVDSEPELDAQSIYWLSDIFIKQADNNLGNPKEVGIYLSDLIKFILRKINANTRQKSISNLKNKISLLNANELASKKMPPAASIGQSLVIIKHLLFGKDPVYIKSVLNNIVSNL